MQRWVELQLGNGKKKEVDGKSGYSTRTPERKQKNTPPFSMVG
jgi:hypothetical protein